MASSYLQQQLTQLEFKRLGEAGPAGLVSLSVPIPRGGQVVPHSVANRSSYNQELGNWPGAAPGNPRRALIIADNAGEAPASLRLTANGAPAVAPPPQAGMLPIRRSPDPFFVWEQHALGITWGGVTAQIAMGLRTQGGVHWWEACRLVVVERTPGCTVVEMGGAIPVDAYGAESFREHPGFTNPHLHKHNWLNGHIYARLHANGVCEIFAHHINSKFSDDGAAFDDVVPVIGFRCGDADPAGFNGLGLWDGSREAFDFGPVAFDASEASALATPGQPGRMDAEDGFLVWQPYEGAELYSGMRLHAEKRDPFILRSREHRFLRGMARTIRFRFSLNPVRSPRLARYVAPAWWYGACEEFWAGPWLPVSNTYDRLLDGVATFAKQYTHAGGFEDGNIPRGLSYVEGSDRPEPGWEGEAPYGLFLQAWRTGDAQVYDTAMRAAWFFTDVIIDHAAKQVRMHGFPPNAFALPMARILASIGAWLETGDPYLIDAARAVIETAHWTEKNSWPRLAVGRDACYLRGAVLLYRYLGTDRYLEIAREGIGHVLTSQLEEGAFGDQGGGARIHQYSSYVVKPWMAFMAIGGVLDYLELFPDDQPALAGVRRMADWLMRERYLHDNGLTGWTYQHAYDGRREFSDLSTGKVFPLKTPEGPLWHVEYLSRFLMFCTLRFNDPAYFEAWLENGQVRHDQPERGGDHSVAQTLQYVPRLQAWLWRATADETGVHARPTWVGPHTPEQAVIRGPAGDIAVGWQDGKAIARGTGIRFCSAEVCELTQ